MERAKTGLLDATSPFRLELGEVARTAAKTVENVARLWVASRFNGAFSFVGRTGRTVEKRVGNF